MRNKQRYCPVCSSPVFHSDDVFCVRCGARLPEQKQPGAVTTIFKCLAYVAGFFAIQFIVSAVAQVIIAATSSANTFDADFESYLYSEYGKWAWLCGVCEMIILFGFLAVFFAVRHKNFLKEIKVKTVSPAAVGGCAVLGAGAQFAAVLLLTFIYALMPFLAHFSVSEDLDNIVSAPNPVLNFLFIAVITPLMEEVIFRGLVYTRLRRSFNTAAAVVLCGIIFGAAHMNIEQFLYAAPLGMLMAAVFEKYGSLWAPFAVHFAFNGGNYLAGFLPTEGRYEMLAPALTFMGCGLMLLSIAFIFGTSKERSPIERKF